MAGENTRGHDDSVQQLSWLDVVRDVPDLAPLPQLLNLPGSGNVTNGSHHRIFICRKCVIRRHVVPGINYGPVERIILRGDAYFSRPQLPSDDITSNSDDADIEGADTGAKCSSTFVSYQKGTDSVVEYGRILVIFMRNYAEPETTKGRFGRFKGISKAYGRQATLDSVHTCVLLRRYSHVPAFKVDPPLGMPLLQPVHDTGTCGGFDLVQPSHILRRVAVVPYWPGVERDRTCQWVLVNTLVQNPKV